MTKFRNIYLFARNQNFAHRNGGMSHPPDRQLGQSTRLVNHYIQILFRYGSLYRERRYHGEKKHNSFENTVIDHHGIGDASRHLMKRIINRFNREHRDNVGGVDISRDRIYLKGFEFDPYKVEKSGRTTRLADKYIEDLYEYGTIHPVDHNGEIDKLINIIMMRLTMEHNHDIDNIGVDNKTIEFLKYYKLQSITYNLN